MAEILPISDLPTPGGDSGTWATKLINWLTSLYSFLIVSLDSDDGTLKTTAVDSAISLVGAAKFLKFASVVADLGVGGFTDVTHDFDSEANKLFVINGDFPANGFTVIGIDISNCTDNVVRVYHTGGVGGSGARFNVLLIQLNRI